jgi:hypothetical protein
MSSRSLHTALLPDPLHAQDVDEQLTWPMLPMASADVVAPLEAESLKVKVELLNYMY